MPPSLSVSTDSAFDGSFWVLDANGENGRNLEGVFPIRDYKIDTTRWGLTRRSSRLFRHPHSLISPSPLASPLASQSPSASPGPTSYPNSAGAARTPADKTKKSRKRPYPEPQAGAPKAKRTASKPTASSSTVGIPPEALNILKPPRRPPPSQYTCLRCRNPPKCRRCTIQCYPRFRQQHFDPARDKLELRQTAPGRHCTGIGVFVRPGQTIAAGAWLGEYLGELLPASAREADTSAYAFTLPDDDGAREVVVDAETHGNWTRFLNSSCRPNVAATPEQIGKVRVIALRASRAIGEGEQLLINYGRDYFAERGIRCCCDAQASPHLPPEEEDGEACIVVGGV